MAPFKDFGKADNLPGEWYPFGDTGAEFDLKIRKAPQEMIDKLNKRYGREVMITDKDGMRRPTLEKTLDQSRQWLRDLAKWALVDIRGHEGPFEVEVAHEDAAQAWSLRLDDKISVGDKVKLDGKLGSGAVREWLLDTEMVCTVHIERTIGEDGTRTMMDVRQDLQAFVIAESLSLNVRPGARKEGQAGN